MADSNVSDVFREAAMNIKRILFPTDLSDCSMVALDYALDLAASSHAELHTLCVNDPRDLVTMAAYSCPSFVASSAEVELRKELERLKPALAQVAARYHFVTGDAAQEICALVESEGIDLIVMSSHGRSGIARVMMGSVAEHVMRKAKCPVLLIKQPNNVAGNSSSELVGPTSTVQSRVAACK
jgi:universal stress protein A